MLLEKGLHLVLAPACSSPSSGGGRMGVATRRALRAWCETLNRTKSPNHGVIPAQAGISVRGDFGPRRNKWLRYRGSIKAEVIHPSSFSRSALHQAPHFT